MLAGFVRYFSVVFGTLLCVLPLARAGQNCTWQSAAQRYGVNPSILYAIARQESGLNPSAIHRNDDGSYDYGLMQVNSRWLPELARYGITSRHLLDACVSLNVGAYILAERIRRHGNTWQAVGMYHSSTPWRRDRYAQAIHHHLETQGLISGKAN